MFALDGSYQFALDSLRELVNDALEADGSTRVPDVVLHQWGHEVEAEMFDLVTSYSAQAPACWWPQPCPCTADGIGTRCEYHGACVCIWKPGEAGYDTRARPLRCPIHPPQPVSS
jgi:hypothetical protein